MFTLFFYPGSASLAPHLLLKELQCDFKTEFVDREAQTQKSSEYLRLNPLGRIPTLMDTTKSPDIVLFESAAICIHICECFPLSNLMPDFGDSKRPKFFQWMMFLTNTFQAEIMMYHYPAKYVKVERDEEESVLSIKNVAENRVTEIMQQLDDHLKSVGDFMLGDAVSACDFYLFMLATWTTRFSRPATSFLQLSHTLRLMAGRPSVQYVCEKENIDISDMI